MRIFKRITAVLISLLILISAIACNGDNLLEGNTEASTDSDFVSLTTAASTTTAAVKETPFITYSGVEDRRDPYVLVENGVYYMYTTDWKCYVNRSGKLDGKWNNEFRTGSTYSGTVVKFPDDCLGCRYAPEVHKYNGMYYMFTSYQSKTTGKRGCTILKANHPLGPFVEITDGHITPADWFCIDGTFYVDEEGQPWMVFTYEEYMDKRENSTDVWNKWGTGKICAAKLSEDLTHFISDPVVLFKANDAPWVRSGPQMIADAPWLYTTENGSLLMLWSSLAPSTGYTVGIARSTTGLITGPWIHEENTLAIYKLTGKTGGHAMIFEGIDGQMYLCIHSPNSDIEIPVFIKIREKNDTLVWDAD